MFRVFHGGTFDESSGSLWATPDAEYAAAFAQLHEGAVWMLTLDLAEGDVLDLTRCELDVQAIVTDLRFAGIAATMDPADVRNPHRLLCCIPPDAIRHAGFRVVRLRESVNWDSGERHAESLLIADLTAIRDREAVPLPDKNYQFPDGVEVTHRKGALVCPQCRESRGDVLAMSKNQKAFRCHGCGFSGARHSADEHPPTSSP
jgi:hypothetical protein